MTSVTEIFKVGKKYRCDGHYSDIIYVCEFITSSKLAILVSISDLTPASICCPSVENPNKHWKEWTEEIVISDWFSVFQHNGTGEITVGTINFKTKQAALDYPAHGSWKIIDAVERRYVREGKFV